MRKNEPPTEGELFLVACHGSGPIERALATVQLAQRQNRLDELVDLMEGDIDA